jgi:hypothetical protein
MSYAVLLLALFPARQTEVRKLNDPLAEMLSGDVGGARLSPDEAWAAFLADREVDERFDLYVGPSDGHAPAARIQAPGATSIASFAIAPDSARIVFHVAGAQGGLFTTPIDGAGPVVALTTAPVNRYEFTPDATRVVWRSAAAAGLHAAPADGSAPAWRLDGLSTAGRMVASYAVAPDSSRVAYIADQDSDEHWEVYVVPTSGGAIAKVSGSTPALANASTVGFTLDSTRVLFRMDALVDERYDLLSGPADGSEPPVRISANAGSVSFSHTPVGLARVLYVADLALHSVPQDGSAPPTLLAPSVVDYLPTPDAERVAFHFFQPGGDALYVRSVAGLDAPVLLDTGVAIQEMRVTDERLVYRDSTLRCVPLDGAAPPWRLDDAGSGLVQRFEVDARGEHVTFVRDDRLYVRRLVGDRPAREVAASVWAGSGSTLALAARPTGPVAAAPDGRLLRPARVLFTGTESGVIELWSAPLDGSADPVRLNEPFFLAQTVGRVWSYVVDGPWVVFAAERDEPFVQQLFTQRLDEAGPLNELVGLPVAGGSIRVSAPYQRVVFGNAQQLWGVPLDGSVPAVLLSPPSIGIVDRAIDPATGQAVFLATGADGKDELHAVAPDGSAPALKISGGVATRVRDFRLAATGARAVYSGDSTPGSYELFRAHLGGSPAPLRISAPLGGSDNPGVAAYVVDPDGTRVAYVVDSNDDGTYELRVVPIDGGSDVVLDTASGQRFSSWAFAGEHLVYRKLAGLETWELWSATLSGGAPVRLHVPLSPTSGVQELQVTADGTRVVFLARSPTVQQTRLYVAPVAGDAPAVRVDGGEGSFVMTGFQVAADGTRAVYRVNAVRLALYSAPLDGSGASVALDGPGTANVQPDFRVLGGSRRVLFRKGTGPETPLWVVAIGGGERHEVSAPLVSSGEVLSFAAGRPGIVYLATQEDAHRAELYHARFEHRSTRSTPGRTVSR